MAGPFKQYARGNRIQHTEEVFKMGMNYTTAPIKEGYLKTIVNMDIVQNGEALVPRPGLSIKAMYEAGDTITDTKAERCSITGVQRYNEDLEKDNLLFVYCERTHNPTHSLNVHPCTNMKLFTTDIVDGPSGMDIRNGLPSGHLNSYMFRPDSASIHNIEINDLPPRHIGTYGFNKNYYYFTKNNVSSATRKFSLVGTKTNSSAYEPEVLVPRTLTPKEAVMWGYNMLADNPYSFDCRSAAGFTWLGVLPFDSAGKLTLNPKVNETITLKGYYAAASGNYTVRWEYKDLVSANWTTITIMTNVSTSALAPVTVSVSFPHSQVMLKVTAFNSADTDLDKAVPLNVMMMGIDLSQSEQTKISDQKTYDLNTCSGMTYWRNRLVLWGVQQDPTMVFMSEVNDPTYFPYPNNVDIFEEPVIHAMPYMDSLIVFTSSKIYKLSLDDDGLSWTKVIVQNNLRIQPWDLHLIQVVKNMIYFKSGNQYYMMVPKAQSMTGELVLAPISTPIESFFNNFLDNVQDMLLKLYNINTTEIQSLELIHYYNYLDYEDIHNVYVFKTIRGTYVNVVLLYNYTARTWRIYVHDSHTIIYPFEASATKRGMYVTLGEEGFSLLQFTKDKLIDEVVHAHGADILHDNKVIYRNYQLVDTGLREHSSDYKKRYREIQLKVNNISGESLDFFTDFLIDGYGRKTSAVYRPVHHRDTHNPLYGTITMERMLTAPHHIPSTTILGETSDSDCWSLNQSEFPECAMWKIRVPVSGKGYAPNLTFISHNSKMYELLNMSYVYRLLNSR